MSFSSYISCGLQSASMYSNEDSDSSSHNSIMNFFQDFPLCCQYTEDVETIFRPPFVGEDPDRERIAHDNNIMKTPWRPPLYRDTSLLAAPRYADKETQPPSASLTKTITPSIGIVSCDDSVPSHQRDLSPPRSIIEDKEDAISLPPDFIPPKNYFPRLRSFGREVCSKQDQSANLDPSADEDSLPLSYSKSQSQSSTTNLTLEPNDVVCGRGSPTSIHPGNMAFKQTIKKHEMTYLCSTRSEKPKIAMQLLDEFRARGVRFIKREHTDDGGFVWMEIGAQRAYEKVCQSLREGAPQLRRQMMAAETKRMKTSNDEKNRLRPSSRHFQRRQQRQDSDSQFSGDTTRIVCDVSHAPTSSFSTVKTTNMNPYDLVRQQNQQNTGWLYHDIHGSKNHLYDIGKHYDVPYYFHLPPHLGGERLFRDRIE